MTRSVAPISITRCCGGSVVFRTSPSKCTRLPLHRCASDGHLHQAGLSGLRALAQAIAQPCDHDAFGSDQCHQLLGMRRRASCQVHECACEVVLRAQLIHWPSVDRSAAVRAIRSGERRVSGPEVAGDGTPSLRRSMRKLETVCHPPSDALRSLGFLLDGAGL